VPFAWQKDKSFEGRHDLEDLLKASALLYINEQHMRRQGIPNAEILEYVLNLRTSMNEVLTLWHNNLRFASEASLRAFLNRIGRVRGIKGDPLKANSRAFLNAAQTVVDRGIALWISRKR
jgi:hypothetical protein